MTLAVDNSRFFITPSTISTPTGSTTNSTQTATIPVEQKPDEFVSSNKKPKSNKKLFLGIGAGLAAAGTVGTILYLALHGKIGKATQLAEQIDFKPAKTLEEAIQFGKDNLKIKKYKGFTENDLDVINFINEGFTNVSNKLKGNLRLPKNVNYHEMKEENYLAAVRPWTNTFHLNKKVYANIDKEINEQFALLERNNILQTFMKDGKLNYKFSTAYDMDSMKELIIQIAKYKKGGNTLKEKINLYESINVLANASSATQTAPFRIIKQLLENQRVKEVCEKNGILTNLEKLKALPTAKQNEIVEDILEKSGVNISVGFNIKDNSEFHTIYHELGHLQDTQKRCFITTDHCKFEYSKYPKELKQWVDNEADIQTACRVSEYASHGEGEFVAETFAKLMDGAKLPDDVIALYKKLNGPTVPGI